MTVSVQRAAASDIDALCGLLEVLFNQEAEFSPDYTRQRRALQVIIDCPEVGEILAARDDGRIIGMINLL